MTMFDRVKEISNKRGLTLAQLNEKVGFKQNVIYSWKTKTPSVDKVKAVADVLNISVDYLLGRESPTEEPDPDVETLQRMAKNYNPEQRKRAIDILKLTIEHERDDSKDD